MPFPCVQCLHSSPRDCIVYLASVPLEAPTPIGVGASTGFLAGMKDVTAERFICLVHLIMAMGVGRVTLYSVGQS